MRTQQYTPHPGRVDSVSRSGRTKTVVLPDEEPLISRDRLIRAALWLSVVVNLAGVAILTPSALGIPSFLVPFPGPRFYFAQIAWTIALFAGAYAWLARQVRINRALVVVGAFGKLGVFTLFATYWIAGDVRVSTMLQASPDLVLAAIFFWWASTEPLQRYDGAGYSR